MAARWARPLACVTELVNQELQLQVEYLTAANRIPRAHAPARLRLSDAERATLAGIGKTTRAKGSGESRPGRETADDSRLVAETGAAEVRPFQALVVSGAAEDRP